MLRTRPWVHLLAASATVCNLACGDEDTGDGDTSPPEIAKLRFSAASVAPGDRVTIEYRVERAETVKIVAMPGGTLVEASRDLDASIESLPLYQDTTFTVTATGKGGTTAPRTATVRVVPEGEVRIDRFEASPLAVAPGGTSTITWSVSNASSIAIDAIDGPNLVPAGSKTFTGSLTVMPQMTTSYAITAQGEGGPRMATVTVEVAGAPSIIAFEARPQMIELGGSSVLSWQVRNTADVTIRNVAGMIVARSARATGTATVSPARNETYTLTAKNSVGRQVTQSVMVGVNRAAKIISFTANPSSVDFGDRASLQWNVVRATRVDIQVGGRTFTSSVALMGSYTVTATRTTDYTLVARNTEGDSSLMVTLRVNPAAPRIRSFSAAPNPIEVGGTTTLSWRVAGATRVRVLDGSGTAIADVAANTGRIVTPALTSTQTFTLATTNPHGSANDTERVIVLRRPAIETFGATPFTFTGTAAQIALSWRTRDTLSTSLRAGPRLVATFPGTPSGVHTITATSSVRLQLTASNAVASVTAERTITRLLGAPERGDTSSTAFALVPGLGASGDITANDVDYYAIVVSAGGNVGAQISDGAGGCNFDSYLSLIGPDGTTVLGSDDEDGPGSCSAIDPASDAFARDLAAGTYFLAVSGYGSSDVGSYALLARAGRAACGNSFVEINAGERCDDGNTAAGDGCSPSCAIEPTGIAAGPGTSNGFTGALALGTADWYRIDLSSAGYIRAETFVPTAGRCDPAAGESSDLLLDLFDASFVPVGSNDDGGIGLCSLIEPRFDAWASVPAGTYWLRVSEYGDNGAVGAYVLDLQTFAAGCGNTIIESGEVCDDGNTSSGDGCSATCAFEGPSESASNNTFATGLVLTSSTTTIARGAISPVGDADFYLIDVPAGQHLDVHATVSSFDDCPENPEARISLFDPSGVLIASNTNGGPRGNCGRVWPRTVPETQAMTAGRYGIRVAETGNDGQIPVYFLHVRIFGPGCGNDVVDPSETCDDGNLTAGDGCDATCQIEPDGSITGPGAVHVFSGAISPAGDQDIFRIVLTSTGSIGARTGAPVIGMCTGADTVIGLLDAQLNLLTYADDSGGTLCSTIDPLSDSLAADLPPGTYYVAVEEYGNNASIPAYQLEIDTR